MPKNKYRKVTASVGTEIIIQNMYVLGDMKLNLYTMPRIFRSVGERF